MGDRGHNRHGPKRGGCCVPFAGRELGPRLTQCGWGREQPPCQVSSSSIHPFGHNRHGPKIGGSVPFLAGGAGSPSSTMRCGPRATSMPSVLLIIQPFEHNRHGLKIWGSAPFLGREELGPHLAQCGLDRGQPACQVPS